MNPILRKIHEDLNIQSEHLSECKLSFCEQPTLEKLKIVDLDYEGRPFILIENAAGAWREMREAARQDGIALEPFSGFRSYQYQKQLIANRLAKGEVLETILTILAIPGFSEHHTGRAVDICTDGKYLLEESFEKTKAYAWLRKNASRFQFRLSYPRGNSHGIIFEPWHWYYLAK